MQATFPVRSVESPLSASSLRNCSTKGSLDCQPSVLRIDESLSPTSLDSVVVSERDTKSEKYTSASPISSAECLEADQVILLFPDGGGDIIFTYLRKIQCMTQVYAPSLVDIDQKSWLRCLLLAGLHGHVVPFFFLALYDLIFSICVCPA